MARGIGEQALSNIAHYLKGMDFPADKQEILNYSDEAGAPDEVVDVLENLPDVEFYSMSDLMEEVSRIR